MDSKQIYSLIGSMFRSHDDAELCKNLVISVLSNNRAVTAAIFLFKDGLGLTLTGVYGENSNVVELLKSDTFRDTFDFDAEKHHLAEESNLQFAIGGQQNDAPKLGLLDCAAIASLALHSSGLKVGYLVIGFRELFLLEALTSETMNLMTFATTEFLGLGYASRGSHTETRKSLAISTDLARDSSLTPRQRIILTEMKSPFTYSEISKKLHLSTSTVKMEAGIIFRILGVKSRQEAVRFSALNESAIQGNGSIGFTETQ